MKRTALIVLMVLSAAALFANGNAEARAADGDTTSPEWSRGGRAFDEDFTPPADVTLTPVELTGTIEIVDDHAILTADGATYLLTIPRIAWYADEVADGTEVTVRGNLTDAAIAHDEVDFDGDGHIMVDEVEIDGEVYAVGPGGRFDMAQGGIRGADRGRPTDDGRFGGPASVSDDYGRRGPQMGPNDSGRWTDDDNQRPMPRGRRG
jgi:hypothetical protein